MMKRIFTVLAAVFFAPALVPAQDWVTMMQDPNVNFYDVQKAFNKYYSKLERKNERKKHGSAQDNEAQEESYLLYKRWENFVEPRVYPTGDRTQLNSAIYNADLLRSTAKYSNSLQQAGTWTLLGPVNNIPMNGGGAGRLNCVRFDPQNSNTIYAGSPAGGLWRSTNGGLNWSPLSDMLAVLGVSDVAIDPTNSNTIYLATGDDDGGDTYSIGVLKSTDGGLTWNYTGLNYGSQNGTKIFRLLIDPVNTNIVFAGTSNGIYKSFDAGVTWVKVSGVSVRDMEFKPGNSSVVYASSSSTFYRSTDNGNNFTLIPTGLPANNACVRMAIAVTPADPNYVYVFASTANTYDFYGLYRSTNSGSSFTLMSSQGTGAPNLMGWDPTGNDSGGQGWYTLSVAASPTNKDVVLVGGVNIWRSDDGGQNWTLNAHWYGGGGAPYVHADIHDLIFLPGNGNTYFAGCDGGIFKTSNGGTSFSDLSNGLQIAEMYRLGCSVTNPNLVIEGWQDNGTNAYQGGSWTRILGGDGMECFIDYSNPQYMYAEFYNGALNNSNDGGATFNACTSGITETGNWVTPWIIDPQTPSTIYAGFKNVWKSTNRGASWSPISSFNSPGISVLVAAPSNSSYLYAGTGSMLYRTTNGGSTWTNVALPSTLTMTSLAVSSTDPNKIWITFSGFSSNTKVFKSTNGGAAWTDVYSSTLPNIPVNCVVSQNNSPDGIYIGTDAGVYYIDTTLTNWAGFSNGLPNVIIDELEIQYSSGKLRAATYGRGLWECSLYNPSNTGPLANFSANKTSVCPGDSVQYTDLSSNNPTSWNWIFPGGTPSSSAMQNPVVYYNTPGTFNDAKLVVTNGNGTDSISKFSYIKVSPAPTPTITLTNNDTICSNQTLLLIASSASAYSWSTGTFNYLYHPTSSGTYDVTVTDAFGCTATSAPVTVVVYTAPPAPVITYLSNDSMCSSYSTNNQWYFNGNPISGDTTQCTQVTQYGNYYCTYTDSNGCVVTSNTLVSVKENMENMFHLTVTPNPGNGQFIVYYELDERADCFLSVRDVTGREVYADKMENVSGKQSKQLDLTTLGSGVYTLTLSGGEGRAVKKIVVY